jgi:cellulose synthase operon protein C
LDDLSKRSDSALIFLTLGIIQMNVGDLEHARDNLTKAQQMASSDPRVYAALGTLYRRRGEDDAASRNYDFALRYERDHAESVIGYSLLVLDQDNPRFEIAARVLKKLLESDPPPSPRQLATAHLARAYLISRVSNELQLLIKPEDQKELSEKTGVAMDKAKAAQDVTKEEETGFSLDRQNPELHLIKGRRLMSEKQLDGAITEFNTAIKMDPTRANYYVELARAYLAKEDPKSAAAALGDAIKRMGESPKLIDLLATIDRKLGKLDEAIAQLKRSLADPKVKNPEGNYVLGSIYLEQAAKEPKKYADAIDSLLKSQTEYFGQGWRLAQTDTELGRAYSGTGDRAKADDVFKKALSADENFEPGYFFYGQFLTSDPKTRDIGRKTLQEYLRRDPKGAFAPEAQKLLQ